MRRLNNWCPQNDAPCAAPPILRNTQHCRYHFQGICINGDHCRFAQDWSDTNSLSVLGEARAQETGRTDTMLRTTRESGRKLLLTAEVGDGLALFKASYYVEDHVLFNFAATSAWTLLGNRGGLQLWLRKEAVDRNEQLYIRRALDEIFKEDETLYDTCLEDTEPDMRANLLHPLQSCVSPHPICDLHRKSHTERSLSLRGQPQPPPEAQASGMHAYEDTQVKCDSFWFWADWLSKHGILGGKFFSPKGRSALIQVPECFGNFGLMTDVSLPMRNCFLRCGETDCWTQYWCEYCPPRASMIPLIPHGWADIDKNIAYDNGGHLQKGSDS